MIENFEHSIIFIGLHSWRWTHRAAAHYWAHTTAAFATEVAEAVGQGDLKWNSKVDISDYPFELTVSARVSNIH